MSEIYREDIAGVDLSEPLSRESVGKTFATGDKLANRIGVRVRRSGKPVDLTGHAVMGYFIRPDRKTVVMEGQAVGNTAFVDIAQACLTERGTFSLAIKVSGDDVTQTLRVLDGSIILTQTDALIDPGNVVPTLDDIFAQIAAMEAATDNANAAAEYANQTASEAINATLNMMQTAASVIIQHADGGSILSVSDSAERPLVGLRLYGKTTQTGTPTPDTPAPLINAGKDEIIRFYVRGKNIFQDKRTSTADYTSNGITYVTNADGTFTANGTNDTTSRSTMTITTGSRWLYLPAGTYTVSSGLPNDDGYFQLSHNDTMESAGSTAVYAYATPKTFTIDKPKYAWMALNVLSGKTVENLVFKPQIEVGAVATEYEPYDKDGGQGLAVITDEAGIPGVPVSSGGNYIDKNGQQWVCDEIDFTRKVYVQRIKRVTLSEMTGGHNGTNFYFTSATDKKPGPANLLCSHFPVGVGSGAQYCCGNSKDPYVFIYGSPYTTLADLKAAYGDAEFLYELATPIETPLLPGQIDTTTLTAQYPNTTAFNNAGAGMKMDYVADTKRYIDNKFAALAAASVNA